MSVSSGSDITIPIQDSPPPPPSPYAGTNGGSKGNNDASSAEHKSSAGSVGGTVTIIDTSAGVEDAADGKSTPEPRGDVTVTVGFVNEAYQDTSPEHNHSEKNGHSKMGNGKKKNSNGAISISVPGESAIGEKGELHQEIHLNEAVNPELINMNILNTIPDKPIQEYGPYDNLDDYFVPVNQHKKFLRSEKLYVTKDKRKESHWKKYVCWVLGATILAAIVTFAVLAGIGLIPTKSPNHFESVVGTTSATESASSSSGGDLYPEDIIISSSPESSLPSSTEINTPPSVPVDATYVPMAASIQFSIPDLSYESALNDKTSDRFQQLASEIQDEVKDIMQKRGGLKTVYSRVTEFTPGSVYVKMSIGWLDQSMELGKVRMVLSNVTSVGQYTVLPISTYDVVNHCKFNNNGCSHNCSFSYVQLDFFCSCGDDDSLYLSPEDQKTCKSMHDDATSSSTSEVPILPEFSSFSPSVSEEGNSSLPSVSPSSEDYDFEHVEPPETVVPVYNETQPTNQPEEEHEHEHHLVSEQPAYSVPHEHEHYEQETSTEADLTSESVEPVSHEHHQVEPEMIPVVTSTTTTTTTTTEATLETVSEELIEPVHHPEVHHSSFVPVETTTSSTTTTTSTTPTPEPLPILISTSEEQNSEEEKTTSQPISSSSAETHSQEEEELPINHGSTEQPLSREQHQSEPSSEELGRTDFDEAVKPTDPVPVIPVPEEPKSTSAENRTLDETARAVSSVPEEEQPVPNVVPTEVPLIQEDEVAETTVIPPVEQTQEVPEIQISQEEVKQAERNHTQEQLVVPVSDEEEATTSVSGVVDDETQEDATVVPELEQNVPHDISLMDVLNFPSSKASTTSTTAAPSSAVPKVVSSVPDNDSDEIGQGRSASSSVEASSEVERLSEAVTNEGSLRSQNLSEDESATETNRHREARLFSTETGGSSIQLLDNGDDKEKQAEGEELATPAIIAEEQSRPSQNVTETASVETADENPEMASVVTKTSSEDEDGASREAVTQTSGSENESSQSASASIENNNNISGVFGSSSAGESSEVSQEAPAVSADNFDSVESTTFPPRSLHHDIDINYLGNNTEDKVNSEPVEPEVEGVNDEHVVTQEGEVNTNDKLVVAPEEEVPGTTTAPELLAPSSEEVIANQDELTGSTTRGITGNADLFSHDDSSESPNRDHRDANADIETPISPRTSDSQEEEIVTTAVPLTSTSTTTSTTTTTTTTTSTTTTTTAAPEIPEVPLADITTTTTTTTAAPIVSNNDTDSRNSVSKNGDSLSQESSMSGSLEESSSSSHQVLSHETFSSSSSSPEDEKSLGEPTEASSSSASYETGSLPSLEYSSTGPSADDQQNELTFR